jgi:diacylglycerol O-acyltransferase 1
MSAIEAVSEIMLPCTVVWFVMFHLIWEDYLNFFAELTRFGDREFYGDWWNARQFDEFNRKWNRPVYEFLYRHIYVKSIQDGHSVKNAQVSSVYEKRHTHSSFRPCFMSSA